MKVALFVTCLGDHYFAEAGADAVRLLRHLGCEVEFPAGQTCCGQPAHNAGLARETLRMAEHTTRVLSDHEVVVLPSGSCASMLAREYPALGVGGSLPDRTWELGAFVRTRLAVTVLGRGLEGRRIAYHQGCHALRQLGLESEAIELLRGAGAQVVDWPAATECCGFGGLFSAKVPAVSAAMADAKLATLPQVDWVVSADPGCLLQLSGRSSRNGDGYSFRHLASVLWEAVDGRE